MPAEVVNVGYIVVSAGRPMPDGERPGPGGWNRIHLVVEDLQAEVARRRAAD